MIDDLEFELTNGGGDFDATATTSSLAKPQPDFYTLTFPIEESSDSNGKERSGDANGDNLITAPSLKRRSDVSRSSLHAYSLSSSDVHSEEAAGGGAAPEGQSGLVEVLNVEEFARLLIQDLRPRVAKQLPPCLPAFILFGAFRFADRVQDDQRITELFDEIQRLLKETAIESRDLDNLGLWLVNLWRLLNLFRQYSGESEEEGWHFMNTNEQNACRLRNFNFEPIRNQLKLRVEEYYKTMMKAVIEPLLTPKISVAILQHESETPESKGGARAADEQKNRRLSRESSKESVVQSLDDLKEFLDVVHTKLRTFGADDVLLGQTFRQLTHWIVSLAMNQLIFCSDLCTFEKAIQIKHNVVEVQNFLVAHELGFCSEVMEPLVQSAHLMQSKKDESNLSAICGEMTSRLSAKQVVSILQHYKPPANFEEERVTPEFIAKMKDRLDERTALANVNGTQQSNSAIMPGTFLTPFNAQPFVYSDFPLDQLKIPPSLRLDGVVRLV
ncbi:Dilute domain-containing protein [Aphelenchoides fujianensis]|nr:Dilute domain-containing protein [Aphelenchoides fujianensis]